MGSNGRVSGLGIEALNLSNYKVWRSCMESYLEGEELWEYVEGDATEAPSKMIENGKALKKWKSYDAKAAFALKSSISPDLFDHIIGCKTAAAIWNTLNGLFKNVARSQLSEIEIMENSTQERHVFSSDYHKLYKATLAADWESANEVFRRCSDAITAGINIKGDTALHIAVLAGKSHAGFVQNLLPFISRVEDLEVKNFWGHTALVNAVVVGNIEAATALVTKNNKLLYIANRNYLPVHGAAAAGQRDMILYLRHVTKVDMEMELHPYTGETGVRFLLDLIACEFYDIALDLVTQYPELVTTQVHGYSSPLTVMAKKASSFKSGMRLNFWKRLLYSGLHVCSEKNHASEDIENTTGIPTRRSDQAQLLGGISSRPVLPRLLSSVWTSIGHLVKDLKHKKLVEKQALELVTRLCEVLFRSTLPKDTLMKILEETIEEATIRGTQEVIVEILDICPEAIWLNHRGLNIFQTAVKNRSEKVFSLIYRMKELQGYMLAHVDESENTTLHLAGQLSPSHKLSLVSGAALQMQRELEWFKEVDSLVKPRTKERLNSSGKTPAMVFSEAHADLVVAGEKWMKDTANSCMITAALIVTVVFAAAITVPGGNDQNSGLPIFSEKIAFTVFFVSNGVSLFASTTSLIMFMSILTSRFAEQDFFFTLPNRLVIGLATLLFSTISMMIAFGAIVYTMFSRGRAWFLIPIAALGCLPLLAFVTSQFPLFVDVCSSTYGRGIFGKKGKRPFYIPHNQRK